MWHAVTERLPRESTVYFADSAHCPYGPRSAEEVKALSTVISNFLLSQNCKLIVVACNTASAAALEHLRQFFDIPFVGMEPAVKPAILQTKTGHVGVLATVGTLRGELFQETSRRYANGVQVHVQAGEGLVEQVEAGQLDTPQTEALLRHYLAPMLAGGVDQVALGCTHYPLLMPVIHRVVQGRANIIDPAQAVARQVERVLNQRALAAPPNVSRQPAKFYTTGHPEPLKQLIAQITAQPIDMPQVVTLLPDED